MMRRVTLAAALAILAAPAAAQERPLSEGEVLDLARSEAVWCENWSRETRDCESLSMLLLGEDGSLTGSTMMMLADSPPFVVFLAERLHLEAGRLCSTGSTEDLSIRATVGGERSVAGEQLARMLLAEAMAPYADARMCQQLLTGGDPAAMSEIITADGERLPEFESTYRLGTLDSGFLLRAPESADADEGMISL